MYLVNLRQWYYRPCIGCKEVFYSHQGYSHATYVDNVSIECNKRYPLKFLKICSSKDDKKDISETEYILT